MTSKANIVLRWIAVLPAAVAAYGLTILATLLIAVEDGKSIHPFDFGDFATIAMIAPIGFIFAGAYTAPCHKFRTAVFLAILHALLAATICICLFCGVFPDQFKLTATYWSDALLAIVSITVTVFACMEVALKSRARPKMNLFLQIISSRWFWIFVILSTAVLVFLGMSNT